jgi:tetratricopeptide (TPR) repeat protein
LVIAALALLLVGMGVAAPHWYNQVRERQLRGLTAEQLEGRLAGRPSDIQARYRLGLVYAQAGRLKDASRELLRVNTEAPMRADVLNDLGVCYLLQQRYYEALIALQGALTLKPDFAAAWANMGRLHLATEMPFTAVKEFETAVRLDPRNIPAWTDLGEASRRTLNFTRSEEAYRRALRLDPNHTFALLGHGKTLHGVGDYGAAEPLLRRALKNAPEDADILVALGRVLFDLAETDEDLNEPRELLEQAVKADPGNPDAWHDLGRLLIRQGEPAAAIPMLSRALEVSPQYSGAIHQLERAFRAVGRTADADRAAEVFEKRSLSERNQTLLEERISRNPEDWDAKATLAGLYFDAGRVGLAGLIVRQLREGKPDHPDLPELAKQWAQAQLPSAPAPSEERAAP